MDIFDLFDKIKKPTATGPIEYLIVGLGNPGKDYENTRHNVGFMAVDSIGEKCGERLTRLKFKSLTAEVIIEGKKALLMKPTTYMNLSGQAVMEAMNFYKIPIEKVFVIYDDVTLDVGKIRVRAKGSDGGHNGIKNIIYLSEKDTFPRVKIGVGKKPHPDYNLADWVLGKFDDNDSKVIAEVCKKSYDLASTFIKMGVTETMNRFNGEIRG